MLSTYFPVIKFTRENETNVIFLRFIAHALQITNCIDSVRPPKLDWLTKKKNCRPIVKKAVA